MLEKTTARLFYVIMFLLNELTSIYNKAQSENLLHQPSFFIKEFCETCLQCNLFGISHLC